MELGVDCVSFSASPGGSGDIDCSGDTVIGYSLGPVYTSAFLRYTPTTLVAL